MRRGIVAVVGRPNVGKSTFFNYLAGERISIVDDTPGVTRDRIYAEIEWLGRHFTLIDTGGIEPSTEDTILKQMREQAELAIEMADAIIFMVDAKTGVHAADYEIAERLRRSKKPVVIAVNKCDHVGDVPPEVYEFYNLAVGEVYAISATHALGMGDLLDAVAEHLPTPEEEDEENRPIRIAIIGKPNAGKSSLTNKILGENRSIVSDQAGTTRDAIDTPFSNEHGDYVIIDTAGLRKKSRIDDRLEHYAMVRALAAIEKADVCLILIDAQEGVSEQDTKVAGYAHNAGKASIFVINKWDLIEKETNTLEHYRKRVEERFPFMQYAPVLFISALTGQRVHRIFELVNYVHEQSHKRITTGLLNELIGEAQAMVPAPQDKGRRLKIQYATQVSVAPPHFMLFCNDKELMHFSYERYLENQMRKSFGFEGTPIRFLLRSRGDKEE